MKTLLAILLMTLTFIPISCTKQELDDSAVTAKVKSRLAANKDTSAIKIGVETTDGVVTLSGVVPTELEKTKATEIATNTEGVKRVANNISVNPASIGATNVQERARDVADRAATKLGSAAESAGEVLSDAAILTKIKSQLYAEHIGGASVHVKDGRVTINGEVDTAQQSGKAEEIAKSTKGVRGVNNQLTIKKR